MAKIVAILVAGLVAGYAVASFTGSESARVATTERSSTGPGDLPVVDLDERLLALEQALIDETDKRLELEAIVRDFLDRPGTFTNREIAAASSVPTDEERIERRRERMMDRFTPERRRQRLEEAGFDPERAGWILQRESELQLESLYTQWQARREQFLNGGQVGVVTPSPLRAELSDAEYEQYLTANGQPTSIRVNQLFDLSPAQYAGLRQGDEILSYNGERIYNIYELNAASVRGESGEAVTLEVLRDGATIQIGLPRGPLGIQGGFSRRQR